MINALSDDDFVKFRNLIYRNSGIFYGNSNRLVLENKILDKLSSLNYSPSQYYAYIISDKKGLMEFLDLMTTNQTQFFRLSSVMNMFKNIVLPKLVEKTKTRREKTIKIWSAGCSTGEEPYSIAMILEDCLPKNLSYKVIASDISFQSLIKAKEGIYNSRQVDNIPKEYKKYIEKISTTNYKIKDLIKEKVILDYHNLKLESNNTDVDVVFCLNVLIYFDMNSKKEVLGNFYKAMADDSVLFIAQSENLFQTNTPFKLITNEYGFYYTKSER